jgi:hypothetical protein
LSLSFVRRRIIHDGGGYYNHSDISAFLRISHRGQENNRRCRGVAQQRKRKHQEELLREEEERGKDRARPDPTLKPTVSINHYGNTYNSSFTSNSHGQSQTYNGVAATAGEEGGAGGETSIARYY